VARIDDLFARVCRGEHAAFGDWLAEVEIPLRRSLAPWARAVDVESVIQETLLRMWLYAQDRGGELEGENASLRWAVGMARNVARNEARRFGRETYLPPEDLPPVEVHPEPPSDPGLGRIIRACLDALTGRPRQALLARLAQGHDTPDRTLAASLRMKVNTFRQNIARARRQVAACLRERGAPIEEHLS
jgi:DNA-directed RNA polymerase specialized sigma24 family protein